MLWRRNLEIISSTEYIARLLESILDLASRKECCSCCILWTVSPRCVKSHLTPPEISYHVDIFSVGMDKSELKVIDHSSVVSSYRSVKG